MKGWRIWLFQINHPHSDVQRRGQIVVSMALGIGACGLLGLPVLFFVPDILGPALSLLMAGILSAGSTWLARSGRISQAGWLLVVGTSVAVTLPMFLRNSSGQSVVYLIIPVLIASVVLRPRQIPLVVLAIWVLLAYIVKILPQPTGPQTSINVSVTVLVMMSAIIGLVNALITATAFERLSTAQATIVDNTDELRRLNASLESQVKDRTVALESALQEVEERAERQELLISEINQQRDVIQEMSVPVLPVAARVLVMPLVGSLDEARLATIHDKALGAIQRDKARYLVLDITGVWVVDSQVAQGLIRVIEAVRLLGAETLLVGVRPEVAQAIVTLGLDLTHIRTSATLQEGLLALNRQA
ncbi:MAG TPA: STAS domain-containing protein [Herpetosiphonaceae bacterium]|nr:STAS domain-containing protein [Herpetosiphonaceae bacterium]